ncbi:MAG TPA: endonuclease domain-containing protein, partial [Prolixibacteraceae bacterium]|nr:endonuclease domain-containing protein [Prolixibacteraceae bacterium]
MSIGDKISMFYNARPIIFERAKVMRENMTQAEKVVWELLKEKKMVGLRFKAQHPIDIFIADFYCHALKLVIEIDGEIHKSKDQKEYDIGREAELEHWGIKVIRFTNEEVKKNIEHVKKEIEHECEVRRSEL